jgi:hypothetical protein
LTPFTHYLNHLDSRAQRCEHVRSLPVMLTCAGVTAAATTRRRSCTSVTESVSTAGAASVGVLPRGVATAVKLRGNAAASNMARVLGSVTLHV